MDWPLTGALTGVALAAGLAAYGAVALIHSGREPVVVKRPAASVLIPAAERPSLSGVGAAPGGSRIATLSPNQSYSSAASDYPEPRRMHSELEDRRFESNGDLPASPLERHKQASSYDYALASTPAQKRKNSIVQDPQFEASPRYFLSPEERKAAAKKVMPAAATPESRPHIETEQWRVVTTPAANYFNLGGHVDRNGVVDGLASGHLREALKKHRSYPQLPPPAKASIDASNINLTKIASYRHLLGMDDKTMEREQGVKFIRVAAANTRDIEDDLMDLEITAPSVLGFFMGGPDWAP